MTPISSRGLAWRAAQDVPDGAYVNLGIGLPERVANYLPPDREIVLHSENGLLGMGPAAAAGAEDFDLINAGKKPVTLLPGGAFFHHADSFGMIRGRHLDLCLMGAFEVSAAGDLANWSSGDAAPAVGGAMDLAQGARAVRILMTHTTRDGAPKLVAACRLPLTAPGVVKRVYTDLAVIDIGVEGLVVRELVAGASRDSLAAVTGAPFVIAPDCRVLAPPV